MKPKLQPIENRDLHSQEIIDRRTRLENLPDLLSVAEFCRYASIGRSLGYDLIRRGEVSAVRLGRRLMVPRRAIQKLLGIDG